MATSDQDHRARLGTQVRDERHRRDLSVEAAAKAGGIGHMTWRKIEKGGSVQQQSYYAVDRVFDWRPGHTLAALTNGAPLMSETELADSDQPQPRAPHITTPPVWTDKHGRARVLRHPASSEQHSPTDQALDLAESMSVTELRHISAMYTRRADSITAELDAIQKKLSELTHDPNQHAEVRRTCEQHPELTDTYQQYLEASVAVAELRTEVHQQQTRPVGDINTQELDQRADQACSAIRSAYDRITNHFGDPNTSKDN